MNESDFYILVAENEPFYAWSIQYYLESRGFRVRMVADGKQATEFVVGDEPDLVILGSHLDGFETCQRIRKFSTVPIILLTVQTGWSARVKGLRLGADDCITKPFPANELMARVQALLRRVQLSKHAAPITFLNVSETPAWACAAD